MAVPLPRSVTPSYTAMGQITFLCYLPFPMGLGLSCRTAVAQPPPERRALLTVYDYTETSQCCRYSDVYRPNTADGVDSIPIYAILRAYQRAAAYSTLSAVAWPEG